MAQRAEGKSVRVFWDYENIPVPSEVPFRRAIEAVTTLAGSYGSLTEPCKAYLDTEYFKKARGQLQENGVDVIDTPHRGRKEVADVMIITQMLCFGLERPASKVVILITGDQGFRYPASILQQKQCTVVLVTSGPLRDEIEQGWSVAATHHFRADVLKLPPKQKKAQSSHRSYDGYSASAPIRSAASTSKYIGPTGSPPRYEEAVRMRPQFLAGSGLPSRPTMPPAHVSTRTSEKTKSKGKSKGQGKGKGKGKAKEVHRPPRLSSPPEVLTLSDEDDEDGNADEDDSDDVEIQESLTPSIRSNSTAGTDSVLSVASSSCQANRPAFAPAFPSASSSNWLEPPTNRSRSRSRSRSGEPNPTTKPLGRAKMAGIKEDGEDDDKEGKHGARELDSKRNLVVGSTVKARKRVFAGNPESPTTPLSKKKKQRVDLPPRGRSKSDDPRSSGTAETVEEPHEVSILVLSDDDEDGGGQDGDDDLFAAPY